jgi:predicted HNH restriction endonuclease
VTLECDYCGEEFDRPVIGVSETYLHNFCSKTCRNRHYTQLYYPQVRKYGADWYKARKEVLRYYKDICQGCGYTPEAKSDVLHVHHIIPRKYTGTPVNSLETLLPLCEGCHKKAHRENDTWYESVYGDKI